MIKLIQSQKIGRITANFAGDSRMKTDRDTLIITIYLIIHSICSKLLHTPSQKQKLNDAEVITIAICSALFFNSNHDKALFWLYQGHYFSTMLSLSRFNRRIHKLKGFIEYCMEQLCTVFLTQQTFIQDSMPLPVCQRTRASRNTKVRGRQFCGYCAAKQQKFFGFRLHLITDITGVPVSVQLLPAAFHDLTPVLDISFPLPSGATILADKAYSCSPVEAALRDFGISLTPLRKKNQKHQWTFSEKNFISKTRRQIETSFSILSDVMGLNRLRARTLDGFFIKVYAAILALIFHITLVIN